MSTILVTGGAGYIGSHTCKHLRSQGYTPVVIDNLSTGNRDAVRWGPFIEGDIADLELVQEVLEDYRVAAVIHFAANASVAESIVDPFKYLHNNVETSLRLLEAMRKTGVRQIVFSSTCATYGIPDHVPISEQTPQRPVNAYGKSKLYIERALQWYERAHAIHWVALRYFNAAGADHDAEIGEHREQETHLIPLAVEAAFGLRGALPIMGTDYPTPDGTAIRDYIHVEDLADAHLKALQYLDRGGKSTAFNLGLGRGYSVREVIEAIESVGGHRVPSQECNRRPGDPPVLVADSCRARGVLSWKPRYTSIEAIVRTACAWHASQVVSFAKQG